MAILRGGRGYGYGYGGSNSCLSYWFLKLTQQHQHQHQHRRYVQALALAQHFLHRPRPNRGTTDLVADTKVVDIKKWKKLDSRILGIANGKIPHGPWTVMKILRNEGFDAYLVGGCVRDLLLNKTPKDFDIITTANLTQIKKTFHRAMVVGQRFPICMVYIQDSVTEVSSFETVANHSETKEEVDLSQKPRGCGTSDFIRWKNSLKRDFTINSLFFNPFSNKIYDYSGGISDLRSLKLRSIIPAEVSFEEDCARILRGFRIAARLGLSFSKDIETALHKLSQSITSLPKGRIFMELNYMLSYGAAEPSLSLLQRFSLLEIILPFHAAYLEQQPNGKPENTSMLMKLFSNLDKVVRCDHPSDCRLWVGVMAFHLALVNKPQDAFVVMTLASILYHGEWKEGIRHAKENAEVQVHFKPELSSSFISKSDNELAEEVSQLAAFVQASINVLTESECLQESMSRYPTSSCSGSVFVPQRVGRDVNEVFQILLKHNSAYEKRREIFDIDYKLLGKGYMWETRFVLGKIILETLGCATLQRDGETVEEKNNNIVTEVIVQNCKIKLPSLKKRFRQREVNKKLDKKSKYCATLEEGEMVERERWQDIAKKYHKADGIDELAKEGLSSVLKDMFDFFKNKDMFDINELIEVSEKEKEDEKPSMEEENGDIKKHQSKDDRPHVDKRRESQDEEVMEEKRADIKKQRRRITDKSRVIEEKKGSTEKKRRSKDERVSIDKRCESPDEEVMEKKKGRRITDKCRESLDREAIEEKKGSTKKKRKSKDERVSMDKRCESPDEEVMEKKKGDIKKKRKSKNERSTSSMDEEFESLGEVVMEEKRKKQKQRKSKNERSTSSSMDEGFESLGEVVMEEKKKKKSKNERSSSMYEVLESPGDEETEKNKGEAKKNLRQRKDVEKRCDIQDDVVIEKMKGISRNWQLKSKDKATDQKMVARKKTDESEGKGKNASRTLLSSLFR